MKKLDELIKLAETAKLGPRQYFQLYLGEDVFDRLGPVWKGAEIDAMYLSLANPRTMLQMAQTIKELRENIEYLRDMPASEMEIWAERYMNEALEKLDRDWGE